MFDFSRNHMKLFVNCDDYSAIFSETPKQDPAVVTFFRTVVSIENSKEYVFLVLKLVIVSLRVFVY